MSNKTYYKKSAKHKAQETMYLIQQIINFLLILTAIFLALYLYFVVYNPYKRTLMKNARETFRLVQDELVKYHEQYGDIFSTSQDGQNFCTYFVNKHAKYKGSCDNSGIDYNINLTLNKTKVEILGLEKEHFDFGGLKAKDFIIDISGKKGENQIGIDRFPVRILSRGNYAPLVMPVNCKQSDIKDLGFDYSKACGHITDVNYLDTNYPFGFDIYQIGSESGVTRDINRNVSFIRADCLAFGGTLPTQFEYCDIKRYPSLATCYNDNPCGIEITKK